MLGTPAGRSRARRKLDLRNYSVQEYLESERIAQSKVKRFRLNAAEGHRILAQSCITYIMHYSKSLEKTSTRKDLATFQMLEYAARTWLYHSSLQQPGDVSREVALLSSESVRHDWLLVHQPDQLWEWRPFEGTPNHGSALYYASYNGLDETVDKLIGSRFAVNGQGRVLWQCAAGGIV